MYKRRVVMLFLLASGIFLFPSLSCNRWKAVPIGTILENPSSFDGKVVTVSGKVVQTFSIIHLRYFVIDDGTGRIPVIPARSMPQEGAEVRVTGVVKHAFTLLGKTMVVIIEEAST